MDYQYRRGSKILKWRVPWEQISDRTERLSENDLGEEFWIFVNEIIDKRLDKDVEMSVSEISKISHLFRLDNYLICVYTSAKGDELDRQLKSILSAIHFTSEVVEIKKLKEF